MNNLICKCVVTVVITVTTAMLKNAGDKK